jgi:LacI family transcriptional regulator
LLLPDLFGEFFSEVIRGADETAQKNHYHLLVSSSHNNREDIEVAMQMTRGRVDGLVIMSPAIDARSLEDNLPRSLPVVLLNCHAGDLNTDTISIDNYDGAFRMVQHLIEHGHRRISIIKGPARNFDAAERLRGYRAALVTGGREVSPALELQGDFSESSGFDAVMAMLKMRDIPSAIFATNDAMAVGALRALQQSGINVPENVALAGFDDIPVARYLTPSLSSVRIGIKDLGERAINQLLHAIRSKNTHTKQQYLSPAEIVVRESCGRH